MKYMLLAYANTSNWDEQDISAQDVQAICDFYEKLQEELTASGELVTTEGLADPSHSKTIRKGDRSVVATDGPYVEAKEALVSFSIVDCESYDRAVEIAARVVGFTGETCEIRPVMEMDFSSVS
ncbi:MAG: YciI family protein [Nocardioidaceae bacterium]